ncbi:MAG: hypothetical protein F2881_03825 [Actinobacteria bacterium]|uniref:Unannotated protein n=1 Tax=freshwater metagenome TaxID=449393 RepID=A0A6J7PEN6_9ZZZZ|nr:hypothetical protein [Actinomycetota bacterium]
MSAEVKGQGGARANMLRGVLLCGSLVFAASSVFLLVAPGTFALLLGISDTRDVTWSLQMVGACLVALSGQMWLVRSAPEVSVRRAAMVMVVGGGVMTLLTLFVPAEWTPLRWGYLAFGTLFLALYLALLLIGRSKPVAGDVAASEAES